MRKFALLVFIVALVGSVALTYYWSGKPFWGFVVGSGQVQSEKRDFPKFTAVNASGAMTLEIIAQKEQSIEIETDDNILPFIRTEVRGNTLHIEREGRFAGRSKVIVRISVNEINGLDLSGASQATVNNVKTNKFDLQTSGASKINISGEVQDLELDASGASKINAENLKTVKVRADVSGASKAEVFVTDTLNADASGASKIIFSGEPKTVNKSASGASSISAK